MSSHYTACLTLAPRHERVVKETESIKSVFDKKQTARRAGPSRSNSGQLRCRPMIETVMGFRNLSLICPSVCLYISMKRRATESAMYGRHCATEMPVCHFSASFCAVNFAQENKIQPLQQSYIIVLFDFG